MSIYLFIALAFGSMSGAAAAPVSRPASQVLIARRAGGADRLVVRFSAPVSQRHATRIFEPRVHAWQPCVEILAGAASPRAPAAA